MSLFGDFRALLGDFSQPRKSTSSAYEQEQGSTTTTTATTLLCLFSVVLASRVPFFCILFVSLIAFVLFFPPLQFLTIKRKKERFAMRRRRKGKGLGGYVKGGSSRWMDGVGNGVVVRFNIRLDGWVAFWEER